MKRRILFVVGLVIVLSAKPAFACAGLYDWFDRVFGHQSMLFTPLGFSMADTLDDLPGYIILGSEKIDDFRGCQQGRIVQFRSGSHVICDDYGYDFASWGTDIVIVGRPHASGTSNHICRFHCKMIVADFSSNDVYDVLCDDYAEELYGRTPGGNVTVPSVGDELDEELRSAQKELERTLRELEAELAPTPAGDRTLDLGQWNWMYDLPGGLTQDRLANLQEMAENCRIAESRGWPVGFFEARPGELVLVSRSMCEDMGDLYP